MADNILNDMENKAKDAGENIKGEAQKGKDKLYQLARENNLDPEHVEDWPQEIKDKLK